MKWLIPCFLLLGCEEEGINIKTPTGYYSNVTIVQRHHRPDYIEIRLEDGRMMEIHGTYTVEWRADETTTRTCHE